MIYPNNLIEWRSTFMDEQEIWKHINGLPLGCEVSNFGNVRINYGSHTEAVTVHNISSKDSMVYLYGKQFRVHRLVAEAFLPNDNPKDFVKHIDGNFTNNRADNLVWISHKDESSNSVQEGKLKGIRVYCKETGKIYSTIQTAAACTGLQLCAVDYGLKHGVKMYGYTFECVDDDTVGTSVLLTKRKIIELGIKSDSPDVLKKF